jgi:N-ethylmaleimide reductase
MFNIFSPMNSKLLTPFQDERLGTLRSRMAMAAMTRGFCGLEHTATELMANYYGNRAANDVGLILTEGTVIHTTGDGYNNVPYIETKIQADSWKQVTTKVKQHNGKIFSQLWHCGRISHEDFTGGVAPLCSSAIIAEGINRQNNKPYGQPRAMDTADFPIVTNQFVQAAQNAMMAGFDGVQLHFGHGYLIDQFLDSRINCRKDGYGGNIAGRCRFALEIAENVISAVGADKVMVRISPSRDMGGIYDWPDLDEMLVYLLDGFDKIGLRMLDISCANANYYKTSGRVIRSARSKWPYFIIGGASLTLEQAEEELQTGLLDMVTFGRALIANPDLPEKMRSGKELIQFDRDMLMALV